MAAVASVWRSNDAQWARSLSWWGLWRRTSWGSGRVWWPSWTQASWPWRPRLRSWPRMPCGPPACSGAQVRSGSRPWFPSWLLWRSSRSPPRLGETRHLSCGPRRAPPTRRLPPAAAGRRCGAWPVPAAWADYEAWPDDESGLGPERSSPREVSRVAPRAAAAPEATVLRGPPSFLRRGGGRGIRAARRPAGGRRSVSRRGIR